MDYATERLPLKSSATALGRSLAVGLNGPLVVGIDPLGDGVAHRPLPAAQYALAGVVLPLDEESHPTLALAAGADAQCLCVVLHVLCHSSDGTR